MNDIQAALGISQFKRIDDIVSRRHVLADRYNNHLKGLSLKLPHQNKDSIPLTTFI